MRECALTQAGRAALMTSRAHICWRADGPRVASVAPVRTSIGAANNVCLRQVGFTRLNIIKSSKHLISVFIHFNAMNAYLESTRIFKYPSWKFLSCTIFPPGARLIIIN
ncbi:hypothetical protein JYU34_006573 [Plutella xylostella]|uniref:Uncharacterized protein n=1 Tax=Plutella xylostella TaxID=51655 RepID=A0ABQ7QSD9_PLUXY|nr:hypothetical protein JYU34_006573 [Plutella xylostella]